MIDENGILDFETRRNIYRFILYNPGLHKRGISRNLIIPKTTLTYHLNYLIKKELIVEKPENGYKRYFISKNNGTLDKKMFSLLREDVPRNIILLLCLFEALTKKRIMNYLKKDLKINKHQTTVGFHLKKLEKMNVIECKKIGREKQYIIDNREDYFDFLMKYEQYFSEKMRVSFFLFHMNEIPPNFFDELIDFAYDVLPHPYHV